MKKLFHNEYDRTTKISYSEKCSECGETEVSTVEFIAEHNAGEYYAVNICCLCLSYWVSMMED